MSLALVGASCTGKTTILHILSERGYIPIISYTTRPKREGEVNGFDYNFISDETFEELKRQDFFAETTEYRVASDDIWKYGTSRKDLEGNKILILNPEGLKNLKKDKSLDITAVLLLADTGTIWNRLRERGDNSAEATRRLDADHRDFEGITEYIDFAIRTDGDMSVEEIADLIDEIYKR